MSNFNSLCPFNVFNLILFSGEPRRTLHIPEHLHGSLVFGADGLEATILRLAHATEKVLIWRGNNVGGTEIPLARLADAGTEVLRLRAHLHYPLRPWNPLLSFSRGVLSLSTHFHREHSGLVVEKLLLLLLFFFFFLL